MDHFSVNFHLGNHCGYPPCCIYYYSCLCPIDHDNLVNIGGYIPCPECFDKIQMRAKKENCTLMKAVNTFFIKKRKCIDPFPFCVCKNNIAPLQFYPEEINWRKNLFRCDQNPDKEEFDLYTYFYTETVPGDRSVIDHFENVGKVNEEFKRKVSFFQGEFDRYLAQ